VPRVKSNARQTIDETQIHDETDWKTLHWRSLEAAYRNSPYFEYYEDEFKPFIEKEHTHHFQLGLESIRLICEMLQIDFKADFTSEYQPQTDLVDLRNSWNKKEYALTPVCTEFPNYIQVFSDRHAFATDLSILDLLFCLGPRSVDYLSGLSLRDFG